MNRQPSPNGSQTHQRVGERLAVARRAAKLSQTEVGQRLGVPQSRIAKLETGDRRLQYLEAFTFAELYDVGVEAFQDD